MTLSRKSSTTSKIRILLTGSTGQVGGDLLPLLSSFADVIAPTRAELDLMNEASLRSFVRNTSPNWIINPAAFTAVDVAESDSASAHQMNVRVPGVLGEEAARCGAALIHFSTDYVFDGSGTKPWNVNDDTFPLSVYGQTKLDGERALTQSESTHLILRTSWVFGTRGKNFLRSILKLATERDELRIVSDQFGAPTWSFDLAQAVQKLILRTEDEAKSHDVTPPQLLAQKRGVYHVASAGETTWFGFAEEFLRLAKLFSPKTRFAHLVPITTREYPTAARRPLNSRLDCSRFYEVFGIRLPHWTAATARVMSALSEEENETS